MERDQRVTTGLGLAGLVVGLFLFLLALNVIPQPDEKFGAPRWIVALLALSFVGAGGLVVSMAMPSTARALFGRGLAFVIFVGFFNGMAIFLTWAALTGGGGRTTVAIPGVAVVLPGWIASIFDRFFVGLFALIFDAIVIWVWWSLLKSLFARGASPRGRPG